MTRYGLAPWAQQYLQGRLSRRHTRPRPRVFRLWGVRQVDVMMRRLMQRDLAARRLWSAFLTQEIARGTGVSRLLLAAELGARIEAERVADPRASMVTIHRRATARPLAAGLPLIQPSVQPERSA